MENITVNVQDSDHNADKWEFAAQDEFGDSIATLYMRRRSECVAIGHLFGLNVEEEHQSEGIARQLVSKAEAFARTQNITVLQATVIASNSASHSLLLSRGWRVSATFNNPKSGNDVSLYVKTL